MGTAVSSRKATGRIDTDEGSLDVDIHALNLDGVPSKMADMTIELPSRSGQPRHWHIPAGILQAEQHFLHMLPRLLPSYSGKWIYVTSSGQYQIAQDPDEAEILAKSKHAENEYVVRLISSCTY